MEMLTRLTPKRFILCLIGSLLVGILSGYFLTSKLRPPEIKEVVKVETVVETKVQVVEKVVEKEVEVIRYVDRVTQKKSRVLKPDGSMKIVSEKITDNSKVVKNETQIEKEEVSITEEVSKQARTESITTRTASSNYSLAISRTLFPLAKSDWKEATATVGMKALGPIWIEAGTNFSLSEFSLGIRLEL